MPLLVARVRVGAGSCHFMVIITATAAEVNDRVAERVQACRTLVLCGAGVSMMPPSALPSGPALLRAGLEEVLTDAHALRWVTELFASDRWARLVPEVAFQRLIDVGGTLPTQAFLPLAVASPNSLHEWLTGLSTRGARLVTTNFDLLLERTSRIAPVLHLHGEIDSLDTVVATIRRVGRGLPPSTAVAMDELLRWADHLVVIGYSGNDRDVMDVIESNPPVSVDWVVRSTEDWAFHNLARLADRAEVVAIVTDLRELSDLVGDAHVAGSRAPSVPAWASAPTVLDVGAQHELVVGLYQAVDLHHESIDIADAALTATPGPARGASIRVLLAHALNRLDRQAEAFTIADQALAEPTLDERMRYRALTERGLSLADDTEVDAARRDLEAALRIAENLPGKDGEDRVLFGSALHNMAYAELVAAMNDTGANLARAESLLVRAIDEKRRTGDLLYLQTSLRNVAALLCAVGRHDDARDYDTEFSELATRFSLNWSFAYRFALEGWLRRSLGDAAGATATLREAHRLFREEGDAVMTSKIGAALVELAGEDPLAAPT